MRHHRGRRGAQLGGVAERVRLERLDRPVGADDLELVDGAFADVGDEDLPQPAVDALAHLVPAAVPGVEVADHGDPARMRRPYREAYAVDALVRRQMRAEPFIQPPVRALDQQMVVERTEHRAERVGIAKTPARGAARRVQPVGEARGAAGHQRLEEALGAAPAERDDRRAGVVDRRDRLRARHQRAQHEARRPAGLHAMQPEQRERVGMPRAHDRRHVLVAGLPQGRLHDPPQLSAAIWAFQISPAYSRIVRSDENQPTRAVFSMLARHHPARSRQRPATSRCAAA